MEPVVGLLVPCICCIWSMAGNEGIIIKNYELRGRCISQAGGDACAPGHSMVHQRKN